jgi:hypothetical protein
MRGSGTNAERIRVCGGFALSLLTDTHPIIVYLLVGLGMVILYQGTANRFLPPSLMSRDHPQLRFQQSQNTYMHVTDCFLKRGYSSRYG